jgi:hypothetical protein
LAVAGAYPGAVSGAQTYSAVLLLVVGTLVAASAGRGLYQIALTRTDNDNGLVTMFFLSVPGLAGLISLPLSWWIVRFAVCSESILLRGTRHRRRAADVVLPQVLAKAAR